jgi:hypothetical protein
MCWLRHRPPVPIVSLYAQSTILFRHSRAHYTDHNVKSLKVSHDKICIATELYQRTVAILLFAQVISILFAKIQNKKLQNTTHHVKARYNALSLVVHDTRTL